MLLSTLLLIVSSVRGEMYNLIQTINLSVGGEVAGHGDWVAYDAATRAVWLSHSPDQNVVILDADLYNVRAVVPYVQGGNGIAFSPKHAFVADAEGDTIRIYDKNTFHLLQIIDTPGGGPDGVYWDSKTKTLSVTLDDTSEVWVFPRSGSHFASTPSLTIPLITPIANNSKGPDVGAVHEGILYQSIDNVIDVIDLQTGRVTRMIVLPFEGATKGVAFDVQTGNLLVGTNTNKSYLVATSQSMVVEISLSGGVDETVFSSVLPRGYLGNKNGFVDVVDSHNGSLITSVPTAVGAHTLTLVESSTETQIWSYQDRLNLVAVYSYVHDATHPPSSPPPQVSSGSQRYLSSMMAACAMLFFLFWQ